MEAFSCLLYYFECGSGLEIVFDPDPNSQKVLDQDLNLQSLSFGSKITFFLEHGSFFMLPYLYYFNCGSNLELVFNLDLNLESNEYRSKFSDYFGSGSNSTVTEE
jgi:hypothetical protein